MQAPGLVLVVASLIWASIGHAAPDEDKLGKQSGYPVGNASNWYYDEPVRIGSFTHQADIPGIFRGSVNVLRPAAKPMPLTKAASEPDFRWTVGATRGLSVDDYLARRRIMGLLIVKDGVVQQTGANATAEAGQTSLGAERNAFWRGVVAFYGKW